MTVWLVALAAVGAFLANRSLRTLDTSNDARVATVFLRVAGAFGLGVIAVFAAIGGALLGAGVAGLLAAIVGAPAPRVARRHAAPVMAEPTAETAVHDVARAA